MIKSKNMKKIRLLFLGLAVALLSACSNDAETYEEGSIPDHSDGTEAFATFKIKIPAGIPSKAVTSKATDQGIPAEYDVKTLHIFIYDSVSPHTPTVKSFSITDNTLQKESETVWKTATPIKTLKASKYIFAGVNLTPAIVNDITGKGFGAFNYKEFPQQVSDLASATNGFVMFNTAYPAVIRAEALPASPEAAGATPITIPVSRVVAKAAAFKGPDFVVNGGGKMRNLTYGWRNINKQFYFIQKIENGIVKDYNWDSYNANDFVRGTDTLAFNAAGSTPTEFSYALENALNFVEGTSQMDQATFLSIRGQFQPDTIIQVIPGKTPQTGADFESIANPNDYGTFYVVRTDDGIINYFISSDDAQQFANLCIQGAAGLPALSGVYDLAANTYTNGLCYYHVLVNNNAVAPYSIYGVYRNQYYQLTVNSIQAPGNPNDNFDKGEIIRPSTWVSVEIAVQDWEIIEDNVDL